MHTRFSTRDHRRVAYDITGPVGAPAVVLLHDLLGQRAAMAPLRDQLGETLRRIAIDLRGHGASATISGAAIDLQELALDVAAVMTQEEIRAAVLIGHGLGAAVARQLATERASLVTAIVAIEPARVGLDGEPTTESDRRAADLAYKSLTDAALDAYLTPRLGPTWRDDLPRPTVAALRRHAPALATLIPALAAAIDTIDAESIPTVTIKSEPCRLDLSPTTLAAILDAARPLLDP